MSYIACIGKFDGVHLGHQRLIEQTKLLAKQYDCHTLAITFNDESRKKLISFSEKEELLYNYGIDEIMCFDFDDSFKLLTADMFIELFLNKSDIKYLVCGPDFRFGNNAFGDVKYLQNYEHKNFEIIVVEQFEFNNRKISSTWIQELVEKKDYPLIKQLIGRNELNKID